MFSNLVVPEYYNGDKIFNNIENFNPDDYILKDENSIIYLLFIAQHFMAKKAGKRPETYGLYKEEEFDALEINSGAYGVVIKWKGDRVIKINYNQSRVPNLSKNYENNKNIVYYDDFLTECLITLYFNRVIKQYSSCFFNVDDIMIISNKYYQEEINENEWTLKEDIYSPILLMERLHVLPYLELMNDRSLMCRLLYIVLHNIYIGQNIMKFIHGDLHIKNVMYKEYNNEYIELYYSDRKIMIKNTDGYVPVIVDFGFSSLELNNGKRIVKREIPLVPSGVAFDSTYDQMKLFGSLLLLFDGDEEDGLFFTKIFTKLDYFNMGEFIKQDEEINYNLFKHNDLIRPLDEVLSLLLNHFDHEFVNNDIVYQVKEDIKVCKIKAKEGIIITNGINYKTLVYNSNIIPQNSKQKYSDKLKIHYVEIDNDRGVFENVCCRENTLDHTSKRKCVTINGTYFNRYGNYTNNFEYLNFMDKNVREVSRSVNINNRRIKILDEIVEETPNTFICGPLLVKDGKAFKIDMFKKENNVYSYSCSEDINEDYVNCDEITPGKLNHLANANPRSIIATKGNKTYFICIRGRSSKYPGATFEQMVDFLVNHLQVDNAINLDGGASISLMWNINGQVYSPLLYPYRKTLSNVISFNY